MLRTVGRTGSRGGSLLNDFFAAFLPLRGTC